MEHRAAQRIGRAASEALIPILLGAIATVHGSAGFFFNNPNGGWEFPAFWAVALLVQAGLGDGAHALGTGAVRGGRRAVVAAR